MSGRPGPVAMHPEALAGEPMRLRWVVPDAELPFVGVVDTAPGALGELLADGRLVDVALTPGAVLMTLRDGLSWRRLGGEVRTALHQALAVPEAWVPAEPAAGAASAREATDAAVAVIVDEALAGPAGAYVRSHGGGVELVDVRDGVVTVRFSGACRGCPALGATLGRHLQGELRRACPLVRAVHAVA